MPGYVLLPHRGVLEIGGEDRRPFLQGLVSNDVDRVGPGRAIHVALLTPQGRYLHDFFLAEAGEAFLLDCEAARRDDLLRRLAAYRLRAKVAIEDRSARFAVAALIGEGVGAEVAAALGLTPAAGAARPWEGGVVYIDPRLADLGGRAIVPRESAETALASAGFAPAAAEDYERLRLRLGVADGSRDLAVEEALLLENRFEELNGVDFAKGCYVGQEVTARTKYRGLVKRWLVPVAIEGTAPPAGTPLALDGTEAGEIRTSLGDSGLALLRLDLLRIAEATGKAFGAPGCVVRPRTPARTRP